MSFAYYLGRFLGLLLFSTIYVAALLFVVKFGEEVYFAKKNQKKV